MFEMINYKYGILIIWRRLDEKSFDRYRRF